MANTQSNRFAFAHLLDRIHEERSTLGVLTNEEVWYRGHTSSSHNLQPTLFRPSVRQRPAISTTARETDLQRLEADLYFEFQASFAEIGSPDVDSWHLLLLMRHYGIPSRCLDWTATLGVALHFAVRTPNPEKGAPTLWLLNPFSMNQESCAREIRDLLLPEYVLRRHREDPKLSYEEMLAYAQYDELLDLPVAVYPRAMNARMRAQDARFTVHGKSPKALEAVLPSHVRKIVLGAQEVEGAREFLKDAGISVRALFPGTEGLSADIRSKYGLDDLIPCREVG